MANSNSTAGCEFTVIDLIKNNRSGNFLPLKFTSVQRKMDKRQTYHKKSFKKIPQNSLEIVVMQKLKFFQFCMNKQTLYYHINCISIVFEPFFNYNATKN